MHKVDIRFPCKPKLDPAWEAKQARRLRAERLAQLARTLGHHKSADALLARVKQPRKRIKRLRRQQDVHGGAFPIIGMRQHVLDMGGMPKYGDRY